MSTTTINASKQTWARGGNQASWSAARDATSSSTHTNFTTTQGIIPSAISEVYISDRKGDFYQVQRAFFFFDTSTITDNITAIDLKIYGATNSGNNVRVAKSTAYGGDGGTAFANSDFDSWTSTNGLLPTPYTSANQAWVTTTNTLSLNSSAISDANNDGYLILVVVGGGFDYPDNEMLLPQTLNSGVAFASTTVFPQLFITHSAPSYGNDIIGIPNSKYDKVISIDKSVIDEIIGV